MKHINIECPQGYEIDKEKSTFEKIVFKEVKFFPKNWENLRSVKGYYVDSMANIQSYNTEYTNLQNRNTFLTREQAQASIALAQLSQLREVYRQGWTPDWNDDDFKCCIIMKENELIVDFYKSYNNLLAFKDREIADLFLENFRDLINQAAPLLFG